MKYDENKTYYISLSAMFTAFTVLFIYLAGIMPSGRISMYFLSSLFISGIVLERKYKYAWISFIAASIIGALIVPDVLRIIPFVLFFGHYGIGKMYIEQMKDKMVAFIVKLVYFNVAVALTYLLAGSVIIADVSAYNLPWPLLIIIAEILFVVYDYLYSMAQQFYYTKIRKFMKPRK